MPSPPGAEALLTATLSGSSTPRPASTLPACRPPSESLIQDPFPLYAPRSAGSRRRRRRGAAGRGLSARAADLPPRPPGGGADHPFAHPGGGTGGVRTLATAGPGGSPRRRRRRRPAGAPALPQDARPARRRSRHRSRALRRPLVRALGWRPSRPRRPGPPSEFADSSVTSGLRDSRSGSAREGMPTRKSATAWISRPRTSDRRPMAPRS